MTDASPDPVRLAGAAPVLPGDHLPGIPRERVRAYAAAVWGSALGGAHTHPVTAGEGVAAVQSLAWDTERLGMPAGRLSLFEPLPADDPGAAADLARRAVAEADARGIRHLSVRVDARRGDAVLALEEAGFRTVDGINSFVRDLADPLPAEPFAGGFRWAEETDVPALRGLAESGFSIDRFHRDPVIPKERADRLHGDWVENAVRGNTGSGVLVAELDDAVAGFFLLAEDAAAREHLGAGVGTLVLITVDPRFRRRGVGRALSLESARRLAERGNRFAEVGTQLANLPASRVYLDAGFRLARTSLSLRRHREAA